MRKLLLIFFISPLILACSDKNELPKGILPKQKMQDVIWDIIRAEEFLNGFVIYKDTSIDKAAETKKWYDKIYQLHKITKKDFDRSYAYYKGHPVLMKEMLDSLSKRTPVNPPGQASPTSKDTANKKDTVSIGDKRKRIFDTLNRKRILKKISAPQ